ncbi:MAG: rod-binding protein [Pseudomonadota bacterium]
MSERLESLSTLASFAKLPSSSEEARTEAARGFEGLLLRQMLSEMRRGLKGGILEGGHTGTLFRQMLDEAIADAVADSGGLGIAKMFDEELARREGKITSTTIRPGEAKTISSGEALRKYAKPSEFLGIHGAGNNTDNPAKDPGKSVETITGNGGR